MKMKRRRTTTDKRPYVGKTVVIGVIGADMHVVANKLMEATLKEEGFNVVNVGVMASQEDFIEAAIETKAEAILISSIYGHGEIDCRGFREKCKEAGIGDILIYIGGNLVVGKQDWETVEKKFKAMGFDRVYPPGDTLQQAIEDLKRDLSRRSHERSHTN